MHAPRLQTRTLHLTLVRRIGDWALYVHGKVSPRYYAVGPKGQVYETLDRSMHSTLHLIAHERAKVITLRSPRGKKAG